MESASSRNSPCANAQGRLRKVQVGQPGSVLKGELQSRIRESLMELPQFHGANVNVHLIGDDVFLVYGEDGLGSALPLRTGTVRFLEEESPTISWTEEHTMTDEQAHIYQRILSHVSKRVLEGKERGEAKIPILDSGAFPEVFESFQPKTSFTEVLKPENAVVWWNVQNSLKLWGYDGVIKADEESDAAMLWAEPSDEPTV